MGLFSSKKKNQQLKTELPPLKFPDLPAEEMLSYPPMQGMSSEEADTIRNAVEQKLPPLQQQFIPQEPMSMPMHEDAERPLFVRIEKYRDVMETLNELKERLKDAGDVLKELQRIKEDEETELASWQNDLESIKEKLMTIDRSLFESL